MHLYYLFQIYTEKNERKDFERVAPTFSQTHFGWEISKDLLQNCHLTILD